MTYSCPFSIEELAYDEAVRIAHDTGKISGDAGPLLETVVDMLDELERPDLHFDCIQIAGTNGKTSTSRFAASILGGEGLKCALYTSPELVHMEERMEIFGAPVAPAQFATASPRLARRAAASTFVARRPARPAIPSRPLICLQLPRWWFLQRPA